MPDPVWNVLNGVSCSSASVCTAVGSSAVLSSRLATKSSATLAERWNGRTWVIQRTPSRAFSELTGVSCSSTDACTAVGDYTTRTGRGVPLAERWNGRRWVIQPTPGPATSGGESIFYGVSCPSSRACIAVGYYRSFVAGHTGSFPLVERWNGHRWAIQSTPNPAGSEFDILNAVSCSSPRACTAVGSYATNASSIATALVERWNGQGWALQRTPSPLNSTLGGVSCSSTLTCTAVGSETRSGYRASLAERWNGHSWVIQHTPNPAKAYATTLSGVSCRSARACTAAGFYLSGPGPVAEGWNGTRWTIQRTVNPGESALNGVSCSSVNACTAVGTVFVAGGKRTLVERWTGRRWTLQPTPDLTAMVQPTPSFTG